MKDFLFLNSQDFEQGLTLKTIFLSDLKVLVSEDVVCFSLSHYEMRLLRVSIYLIGFNQLFLSELSELFDLTIFFPRSLNICFDVFQIHPFCN